MHQKCINGGKNWNYIVVLTLKAPSKVAADDTYFFYFYLLKKIRLDVSCESSARQRIYMKYQVFFSLKNNEKVFMNAVCCSRDWCFNGQIHSVKFMNI